MQKTSSPETLATEPPRILVADDDPATLRLVSAVIANENFTVVQACNGGEAFKILRTESDFAAVITDMVMPNIEGPELIHYMRSENRLKRIPVIMMTAEESPKLPCEGFDAGAVVFIPKPIVPSQLRNILHLIVSAKNPSTQTATHITPQSELARLSGYAKY